VDRPPRLTIARPARRQPAPRHNHPGRRKIIMAHTKDARFQERRQLRKLRQRERDIAQVTAMTDLGSTYPAFPVGTYAAV
jgi:hypothetical protein